MQKFSILSNNSFARWYMAQKGCAPLVPSLHAFSCNYRAVLHSTCLFSWSVSPPSLLWPHTFLPLAKTELSPLQLLCSCHLHSISNVLQLFHGSLSDYNVAYSMRHNSLMALKSHSRRWMPLLELWSHASDSPLLPFSTHLTSYSFGDMLDALLQNHLVRVSLRKNQISLSMDSHKSYGLIIVKSCWLLSDIGGLSLAVYLYYWLVTTHHTSSH